MAEFERFPQSKLPDDLRLDARRLMKDLGGPVGVQRLMGRSGLLKKTHLPGYDTVAA